MRSHVIGAIPWAYVCSAALFAQEPAKVDFRRDVQPLLKANCIGCHGPTQQMNNFRLDRRRDAMRGGTIAMIAPGNSAGSRLYRRLIGSEHGLQMPPTGPLRQEQIDVLKTWIDQGAEWPDDVSGDAPAPPPNPKVTRMVAALRGGDLQAFKKVLRADPNIANVKASGGATPLMYAALYGDSDSVRLILRSGGDPNLRNDAGATALMWSVGDLEKTRLLLDRAADANARSDDGRTPLLIAAGRFGSGAVVKLLLDHGANPSAKAFGLFGEMTPLAEAAYAGDQEVLRMLMERGADVKTAGVLPLAFALRAKCDQCVAMLLKSADPQIVNIAMFIAAPPLGDAYAVQALLDHGGDARAKDREGHPILMMAASSEALPLETVKTLLDRGADCNAKGVNGETAIDLASRHGATTMVDLLTAAGAKQTNAPTGSMPKPKPAGSLQAAVERTIPLLQRTDVAFIQRAGCVSCHNNTLTAMTIAAARKKGFRVNEEIASKQLKTIANYIDAWRDRALRGVGIPGDSDTVSYIMIGLAAQNYPPDEATDAMAHYLKDRQSPDGRWRIFAHRPPIESSDFQVTAASLRVLRAYAPKSQRAEYEKAVQLAARWLANGQPRTTEDRAFQLLGLAWAGADKAVIARLARELAAEQRSDGGWAQLRSLSSDAYATGQVLVALQESGAMAVSSPAYQRGSRFLLGTQLEDGSWFVKTRAVPIQPYFESEFPHGHDQWISASATNWAATALALAR
jgi:ankyrin repeat protein